MQIALWSNEGKGSGTTTLTSVLATRLAANHNYKIFLTHCLTSDLSMESYLLKPSEHKQLTTLGESNVDGLFRLIKNGKLTKDTVKDYCFSLLAHSNLDFLTTRKGYELDESFNINYGYLLYTARQFYDIALIDLEIPFEHPLFHSVIKETDILVVVCPQNRYRLHQMTLMLEANRGSIEASGTKIIYVINKSNSQSETTKKVAFGKKKPFLIPYEPDILENCNRGELVDFLLRHCYSRRKNSMSLFMDSVDSIIKEMLKLYEEVNENVI